MAFIATQSVTGRRQSGSAYTRTPAHWAGQEFRSGKSLGRVVAKPEKCSRKRAMQLKKCRTSRLRAMLTIASFIAAFPTSHIMSEKPIFSVPVSRSGEQRGVHTWSSPVEDVFLLIMEPKRKTGTGDAR